jgi:hypothetical protein
MPSPPPGIVRAACRFEGIEAKLDEIRSYLYANRSVRSCQGWLTAQLAKSQS